MLDTDVINRNIIKRDGTEVLFDPNKIVTAISKANAAADINDRISDTSINNIKNIIENRIKDSQYAVNVEDIQDMVESEIDKLGAFNLAKSYILYRYKHTQDREMSSFLSGIVAMINDANEEVKQENSNKDARVISTQRDYTAGDVSKMICRKLIFSDDVMQLHDKGIIHIHDTDYRGFKSTNCCLVNLDDMLQNGTVITDTKIDKPHLFSTACNIATQIMAQVASGQYGGSTYNIYHLAKFVNESRKRFIDEIRNDMVAAGINATEEQIKEMAEKRTLRDIKDGVQTLQYQILTLMTTNGQTPFVSLFMWIDEAETPELKHDYALVIEEILRQRIKGVKNKKGYWIPPTFPKLLYVTTESNIHEDSEYFYLTKLAAECTSKRMVPDYISDKKMKENKEGNTYGCMGCVQGDEIVTYKLNGMLHVESIKRMWYQIANTLGYSNIKGQRSYSDKNRYIDVRNLDLQIYDSEKKGFVKVNCVNKNISRNWLIVKLSNGRIVEVTDDHPFTTSDLDLVHAKDLKPGMKIKSDYSQYSEELYDLDPEYTWLMGIILADGCYDHQLSVTIDGKTENDIEKAFIERTKKYFNMKFVSKLHVRGIKGTYKELYSNKNTDSEAKYEQEILRSYLLKYFGGKEKINRHIPSEAFNFKYEARLGLLAGLIDADGYIHNETGEVMIGSTNKELALQQMALAQSCGMRAKILHNIYRKNCKDCIRYRVTFYPTEDLVKHIVCEKKRNNVIYFEKIYPNITDDVQYNEVLSIEKNTHVLNKDGWAYSYDVSTDSEHFTFSGIYSHNCRSFLSPWKDPETGEYKFWGRLNTGVVTINLPYVALEMKEKNPNWDMHNPDDVKAFFDLLDSYLEYCHKALLQGHKWLEGTLSDVSPILWQNGALARLNPGETIDSKIFGGYSTSSLGFVGLHETMMALTGKSHYLPSDDPDSNDNKEFAYKINKYLSDKCKEWNEIPGQNHGFSLYGTPEESTTYKFAKAIQKRFGNDIKGVTDKNYIINSYHVNVKETIDAFTKLKFESYFQDTTPGGAISYIESGDMTKNIEGVIKLIQYMYETSMYAEINNKPDFCNNCEWYGEMKLKKNDTGKLIWYCPNCGCTDETKLQVFRRTCGYIGSHFWNQGRTQEINERKEHVN